MGIGVVTVLAIDVVVALATVVGPDAAMVTFGAVVAGNVVNDNAAFFVFGVFASLFAEASEPPQALMARRAAAVSDREASRGEIFISSIYQYAPLIQGAPLQADHNQISTGVVFCAQHHSLASLPLLQA